MAVRQMPLAEVSHACLTCPQCGLVLESFALRCPRCLEPLPLGCDGNCKECGKRGAPGASRAKT